MHKKESVIYPLFSMPLMAMSLEIDNNKILKFIKETDFRKNKSSDGCYVSKSMKLLENKELKKEKNIFLTAIQEYVTAIGYSKKFKILNSWGNKVLKNCQSHTHVHTNTWLSGVYYTQDNSSIAFKKNWAASSFFNLDHNRANNLYSAEEWKVTAKQNTLLLFPSEMQHKVQKNILKTSRYSLSFVINPVGTFNKGNDNQITYA